MKKSITTLAAFGLLTISSVVQAETKNDTGLTFNVNEIVSAEIQQQLKDIRASQKPQREVLALNTIKRKVRNYQFKVRNARINQEVLIAD